MKVLKFGGTSLADRPRIEGVTRLVHQMKKEGRVVVVASAVAGITDRLVGLIAAATSLGTHWTGEVDAIERQHLEILAGLPSTTSDPAVRSILTVTEALRADLGALAAEPTARAEIGDRVMAAGEKLSVQLLAATLQSDGCSARPLDATGLVVTDSTFGEARVDFAATRHRCEGLRGGRDPAIPIITGFIGADPDGRTTTLGRGGSDLSAAVLGAALDAERVEIWTDVDGVLTAPPRLVPNVSSIPWLSYEEAAELSFFGAKVLHPKTIGPLVDRGIPIVIRNTLAPARRGTQITRWSGTGSRVVAVSAFEEVTVIRVRAFAVGDANEVLMSSRASSDGVTLVAVPTQRAEAVIGRIQGHGGIPLEHDVPASIVTLVGHDIALQPWVAGRALESLARRGIVVRSFAAGASPHTVAILVDRGDLENALCTIHDALMLDRERASNNRSVLDIGGKETRHVSVA